MIPITVRKKRLLLYLLIAAILFALFSRPSVRSYFRWHKDQFELVVNYMQEVVITDENPVEYITRFNYLYQAAHGESEYPPDVQKALHDIFIRSKCIGISVRSTYCRFRSSKGDEEIGIMYTEANSLEEAKRMLPFLAVLDFRKIDENWYVFRVLSEEAISKMPY